MQVICTDGTTFTCQGYELTKYGVKLLDEARDPEDERYDTDPDDVGYVPHDRLWYIVPDGVRPTGPPVAGPTNRQPNPRPTERRGSETDPRRHTPPADASPPR